MSTTKIVILTTIFVDEGELRATETVECRQEIGPDSREGCCPGHRMTGSDDFDKVIR